MKILNRKTFTDKSFYVWFLLVLFVIANIYFTIQASSIGAELNILEEKEQARIEENKDLSSTIIELNSLKNIGEKSDELGFVKPETIIYIAGDTVVAKAP